MNTKLHRYRVLPWIGLKRYFFEWRKRAIIRRELAILSDHRQWEDIVPPTPPSHDV